MKYKWSVFNVNYPISNDRYIIKNYLTGSIIVLNGNFIKKLNLWLCGGVLMPDNFIDMLTGQNGFIVPLEKQEFNEYKEYFLITRSEKSKMFSLYFLPTMKCQLNCEYCFENGVLKQGGMSDNVLESSVEWLGKYFVLNKDVTSFRCVAFGGEPLLEKELLNNALNKFQNLAKKMGKKYWTEIITNGVYFSEDVAMSLGQYNIKKIQITLDGYKDVHDMRRSREDKKPTFDLIISNIKSLLKLKISPRVDLRLSLDNQTADSLPYLIKYLSEIFNVGDINLSLGLIVASLGANMAESNKITAQKIIETWSIAKQYGFEVPEEFITGPWCVAIAKNSAVLQPDGSMQKCFCTVGRSEFNFGTIFDSPTSYAQDVRFEQFSRIDKCFKDKCPYLPVCGGGCVHDSLVKSGETGFTERFCQRDLIADVNKGLLLLKYNSKTAV